MKISIIIFILFFSFNLAADDISDFEIEGMSIGDSLLDHFSEEEINNARWYDGFKNKKFTNIEIFESDILKQYYSYHFLFKTNDKSFEIYGLTGTILFANDITNCLKKLSEIDSEIFPLLKDYKREKNNLDHAADPSGKSKIINILYSFDSGAQIAIECYDWSQEMRYSDHLRVSVFSQDFAYFINNEAY